MKEGGRKKGRKTVVGKMNRLNEKELTMKRNGKHTGLCNHNQLLNNVFIN